MRAVFLLTISLIIFVCDYRFHYFSAVRSKVVFAAVSVQSIINFPQELFRTVAANFISKQKILAKNDLLRSELLSANVRLQRLNFVEHENSQLRSLLNYAKQIKGKVLAAQLLLSAVDNFGKQITIDKGKLDGVYVGQPVLDAHGLIGQVVAVEENVGRVLLITNRKSAIPVMVMRNGLRAIVIGDNDNLELINTSETADIKVGDALVTSGIERRFPAGYQVGIIKEVKRVVGERFMKVLVAPMSRINSSNPHVLLIWPDFVEKTISKKKILKDKAE